MKKVLLTFFSLTLVAVLAACGNNNASNNAGSSGATTAPNAEATSEPTKDPVKLVIGASPVPHAEILKAIAPLLEKDGITLEIKEFTDYIQPNVQLDEKELDANFFQHQPYLDDQNKNNKTDLVSVASVHVEPFGAYSKKIKSIDELADGAKVAIPNDATNGGRALILLAKNGLITLKDDTNIAATKADITENKKISTSLSWKSLCSHVNWMR